MAATLNPNNSVQHNRLVLHPGPHRRKWMTKIYPSDSFLIDTRQSRAYNQRMKICPRCHDNLDLCLFSKDRNRPDGRSCWCKKCVASLRPLYVEAKRTQARKTRRAIRFLVLCHYSQSEIPRCACCGETILEFLSLDHIHGGGNKHKREVRHVYIWIVRHNFPEGFRVLCHNCNQSLGAYGYCPHVNPESRPA